MIRRNAGSSRANNRADTTRTKRLCWSFFLVVIVCVFYVNFLRKLDQIGTQVEEASNKGATIKVAVDEPPQFSFVVKGQQNNTDSDGGNGISLVETNQASSIAFDSEESEVVKDQLPQSSVAEEDKAVDRGQHNSNTESDDEPASSAGSSSVVLSTEDSTNSTETNSTKCKVHFKNEDMRVCHFIPYDGNFGDELGPAAILKLLENKFYPCSVEDIPVLNLKTGRQPKVICLFNLGSIFHMVQRGDHIWGTGINPFWQKDYPQNVTVYAVRGPKTEALVRNNIGVQGSIGHGDPGFLIPSLFPKYQKVTSKEQQQEEPPAKPRICFVPHHQDRDYPELKLLPPEDVIAVKNRWQPVVEAIQNCDYVASSSLHGVIIADAIGIPKIWFQFPGGETSKTEGSFKYDDYFQSIGQTDKTPTGNFSLVFDYDAYDPVIPESKRNAIVKSIMSTFPYDLFETDSDADSEKAKDDIPIYNGTEASITVSSQPDVNISSSTEKAG